MATTVGSIRALSCVLYMSAASYNRQRMTVIKAMLAAYGVKDAKTEGIMPAVKSQDVIISNKAAMRIQGSSTEEEMRFLKLHVKLLKVSGMERAAKRYNGIYNLFRKLPMQVKLALFVMWLFFCLIMFLPMLFMVSNVLTSKIAIAKLLLMLFFTLMIFGLQIMIGI